MVLNQTSSGAFCNGSSGVLPRTDLDLCAQNPYLCSFDDHCGKQKVSGSTVPTPGDILIQEMILNDPVTHSKLLSFL